MGADSARAEDTQACMRRAREDLRAGRTLLDAKPPLLGPAAFHSQQAAEKALKAFLTWHDAPFRRTHDLGELGRQCTGLDDSLEETCRRADELTVYAWIFRYPGDAEGPPAREALEGLELAGEVYEEILTRFPDEARP